MEQDFEKALKELESIVQAMEEGNLSLEDSLRRFERGMELARQCQTALEKAEQRVQVLLEKDGAIEARPLEEAEDKEDEADEEDEAEPLLPGDAPETPARKRAKKKKDLLDSESLDDEIPF